MPRLIPPPHFNAGLKVPAHRDRYIAAHIADWSRSASCGLLAACLILAACAPPSASAFGTGEPSRRPATPPQGSSSRKTVIDVRTSPGVYLPGPAVRIEVYSTKPVTPRVIEFLQQTIERTLLRNDPRLRVAPAAADTSIAFTITDLTVSPGVETRIRLEFFRIYRPGRSLRCVSPGVETRIRLEYQQIGLTTVTDPETGGVVRYEPQYAYVDVPYRALVLEGRMSVKCDVTDVATGILLYSDKFDALYTDAREVGGGPSVLSVDDLNFVYLKLADTAAGLILAQLSPRVYSEIVALSSGKLKEASKLLEAGLWSEALTLLSSMPAFKDPKDDAYRLYSIGVAHEAIAYTGLDLSEKKRQLERAVDNYRRAAELKPKENMFWAPKNRAEFALSQTSGLVTQVEVFEEAKKPGSKAAASPDRIAAANTGLFGRTGSPVQSGPILIGNQTVVQWVKSVRSSDYITASIKHAAGTRFDLSAAEVLKLRREGVTNSVLKAMAEAQQGRRPGGRTRAVVTAVSLLWWLPFLFGR